MLWQPRFVLSTTLKTLLLLLLLSQGSDARPGAHGTRSLVAQRVKGLAQPPRPAFPVASLLNLAAVPTDSDHTRNGPKQPNQHQHLQQRHRRYSQHQEQTPTNSDFVFATGSCRERMQLAKSTRAWRQGVRAFVLTDQNATEPLLRLNAEGAAHNESYAFFPDDGDVLLGGVRHGTKSGDTRAALAPFAAHRHFGETYKWMLYGDDDTLFFLDPVRKFLSSFDHNLPLAFSDNLWYNGLQPNPHAPRCLPCHMADETLPTLDQIFKTASVREQLRKTLQQRDGLKDEAQLDAAMANRTEFPGRRYLPRPACSFCTPQDACPREPHPDVPCTPAVAHGGAGMIFSVGLLRSLPYDEALACLRSFTAAPGGDYLVSHCLWRHGVAFTDPGPLVRHLYDPHYHTFGSKAGLSYLWDPIGSMTHGRCNGTCRWMLRNTLSLHLKGRHFRSWRMSSINMWGVAAAVKAAQDFLDVVSRDGGAGVRQLPYGADLDDTAGFAAYEAAAAAAAS